MSGYAGRLKYAKGRAFTLIELLVVVAIIMLLAGLLFPAFTYVREVAKKTKAKAEVKQLDTAWRAVLSDYRTWDPIGGASKGGKPMDQTLVTFLQGKSPANTRGVTYMEFDASSTNSAGAFVDPWYRAKIPYDKNIYWASFGSDGEISPKNVTIYRDVGAWSLGKDGAAGTTDDVNSWD